nr:hypothetical protein [Tanacetum cinerariifolium]
MPLLAPMLMVPGAGDGADAVLAGVAAAHDVSPPPIVPPTHSSSSTPRPSFAPQVTPSNEAPQTPSETAAGGAEDSAVLIALSLKLDRCIHRVTTLENELGVTKKVLGGSVLKLVTRVKQLEGLLQQQKQRLVLSDSEGEDTTPTEQDIDLEALHTLAHTSLGGDSSDMPACHDAAEVPTDTSMPFCSPSTTRRRLKKPFSSFASAHAPKNVPAGAGISAAATTIPAGSPMDVAVHGCQINVDRNWMLLSSFILRHIGWTYWLKSLPTLLSKKLLGDNVTEDNMNERLGMLLLRKRRELAEQSRVPAASTQVPADVPAALSFVVDVSVSAATTPVVPAAKSRLADTPTASAHVSVEPSVAASTHFSLRKCRKHITKKRVTPIVDMADVALIKFDSDSGSDDDPLPYAPYASWEMKLLGVVDNLYQREDPDTFALLFWRLYPYAQVHILETVDGRVIYMFVDVSYPLTVATLERMLKHELEVFRVGFLPHHKWFSAHHG